MTVADHRARHRRGPRRRIAVKPGPVPWAKAGIIIKASTKPGSAYAAMMATGGHGVRMQYNYTGDMAGLPAGPARPRAGCG